VADNCIKHPLIGYIVVPGHGCWVNKATNIESKQGLCATKRENRIRGGDQTTPKMEGRGGLNVQNASNGELTPGEKSRGTRHPQTIRTTCAKGGRAQCLQKYLT
jgi:hypothetical protein